MLIRYPLDNYIKKTLIKVSYKGGEWELRKTTTQQEYSGKYGQTDGQTQINNPPFFFEKAGDKKTTITIDKETATVAACTWFCAVERNMTI